jgi:hypothetical protein
VAAPSTKSAHFVTGCYALSKMNGQMDRRVDGQTKPTRTKLAIVAIDWFW